MKGPEKLLHLRFALRVYLLVLLCFFVLQGSWCAIVWAKAVPSSLAHEIVSKWLAKEAKPMGSPLGSEVESVKTFTDSNGQPVYYVVVLKPSGFVVVSADDLVEPIVCFSSEGSYDSSARNPLGALVSRDVPARINVSRSVHAKLLAGNSTGDLTKQQVRVYKSGEQALGKWTELLGSSGSVKPVSSISDVRVSPLLSTKWGQDVDSYCGNACYNYYTPPYSPGDGNNYPAGCVATAMAQYMRFWQYPVSGVGAQSFTITVGCDRPRCEQTANLRGGDGNGGPYDWSQMPYYPNCSTTDAQRQAIGALTYDAGVAIGMDYEVDGSGADISDAAAAMVYTFGYSNAIMGGDETEIDNIGEDGLNGMINPNLDSGNPVILAIYNSSNNDGHAVVADGYGYQSSTLYHHLNMGWDGDDDVWYNLPNINALSIDPSAYSFNVVDNVIYNIYIIGTGEIISGRVTEADSKTPVSNAAVTAVMTGGGIYQTTTNAKGIYALANVPSYSTYTISVVSAGHLFADVTTSTGQSQDSETISGNCWAIDFVSLWDFVVGKCTVSAGSKGDSISFSGIMNATADDFNDANNSSDANFVEVTISDENSDDMDPCVITFPVNGKTWKKGKFSYSGTENGVKKSFSYNMKTGKFAFAASKINLSGLECPMTINVNVGDFAGIADLDEAIVNGPKTPIPIELLMGVKNSLRVDKSKFTRNRSTGNITQVAVSGGFSAISIDDANLITNQLDITVGSQTFTVPIGKFKNTKGKFTCSKVSLSGGEIAAATFDFNKCTFILTIKGTKITDPKGDADFKMVFGGFNKDATVSLP